MNTMIRGNGSVEAVKDGLTPLLNRLNEVEETIHTILAIKGLEAEEIYVFQSRAMGTHKETSDFDMYVQLKKKHTEWIEDEGVMLYEGKHSTQFTGNWHPLSLEKIDPWTLKWYWPYKVFHDTQTIDWYKQAPTIPPHLLKVLDELRIHITLSVHPEPPRKKEYGRRSKYYVSFKELREMM